MEKKSGAVPIKDMLALIAKETDEAVLKTGKARQTAVCRGEEPDFVPIFFDIGTNPERADHPSFNLEEQFHDPEKMLYEQLWASLAFLRTRSDAVPSVRVSFGTAFLASVFGLNQMVFPDKMPWLQEHLAKENLLRLKPEDLEPIGEKGLMPECRRYIEIFKKHLVGTPIGIYLPDTQGPFDIAHLVYRDEIFTDFYEDPDFIRHLLSLCSYVYRRASGIVKEWIGEPFPECLHANAFFLEGAGVRSCEDSTTLLSPRLVVEYLPFLRSAIAPFGAWIHFCGDGRHLLDPLLAAPEVKAVNFGNPEKYDWEKTMGMIMAAGKFYAGTIPRGEKEPLEDYFRKTLALLKGKKKHLIFGPLLRDGEATAGTLALWRSLQTGR